mgnify:CR=1 FL=1
MIHAIEDYNAQICNEYKPILGINFTAHIMQIFLDIFMHHLNLIFSVLTGVIENKLL